MRLLASLAVPMTMALIALAPASLAAQDLAVPGRTPANAHLVVSMPDSTSLWGRLARTPMHEPMEAAAARLMGLGDPANPENAVYLDGLEELLGYSVRPSEFFTRTASGMDLYFLDQGGQAGYLVNFAFNRPADATRAFNQVRTDAAQARGTSRGVGAETAVETVSGRARLMDLPAFEIFLAVEDNILTYGTQKRFVESALANEGGVLFQSNYFRSFMDPLAGTPSDVWAFGEPQWALDLAADAGTRGLANVLLGRYRSAAVKFRAGEDGIHATSFIPQAEMPPAERRYNLAAPPPGQLPILDAIPAGALFSYTTNSFDGLFLLESAFEAMESGEGGSALALSPDAIEQAIETSRDLLGFDLEQDLLANLGPDLAVALWGAPSEGNGSGRTEALLVSHLRDPQAVREILATLEEVVENSLPAPPAPSPAADGEAAPAEPASVPPLYADQAILGESARVVNSERLAGGADWPIPSYAITREGRLVLALSEEALRSSLAAMHGEGASLRDDPLFTGHASSRGGTPLNAQWLLHLPSLSAHEELLEQFPLDGPGIPRVGVVESFSLGEVYLPEGTRREFRFLLP